MTTRVGIITWQGRYNYGNRLQNYATCKIYEKLDCETVNLILQNENFLNKAKSVIKMLVGRKEFSRESTLSPERLAAFDSFNRHLSFQVINSLHDKKLKQFDYFSVGSDTIWNLGEKSFYDDWRYLQFCEPAQRIALAPSFGSDSLTDRQMVRLSHYVEDYPCLSMREESGVSLIRQASGKDAVALCDPTLVLDRSDWRRVSRGGLTPDHPYIFAYLLGERSSEANDALGYAVDHVASDVILLSDREEEGELPAGPAEFISLIENAAYVITDSFHGAVFAALFETPLSIVHRIEGGATKARLFSRLDNLSHKLGLENKVMGSDDFSFERAADFDGVYESIEVERLKFMNYLKARLHV